MFFYNSLVFLLATYLHLNDGWRDYIKGKVKLPTRVRVHATGKLFFRYCTHCIIFAPRLDFMKNSPILEVQPNYIAVLFTLSLIKKKTKIEINTIGNTAN